MFINQYVTGGKLIPSVGTFFVLFFKWTETI